jgi:2-methylcitrate dehydratase PrpD
MSLQRIGEAIAGLTYEGLTDELRDAARKRAFDNSGATAVGLATPEGAGLLRLTESLGSGSRPGIADTIRLYVSATRCTEIDDINIASCATVGSVIVPLAAAAADEYSYDDETFIEAVVAGYQAMVRLGTAIDGANILYKGIWPTYVTAPFASAAVGAKLLDLDAKETTNALAIALSRSAILQGRPSAGLSPRWYVLGCAAADGFAAAHAAAAGIGGDPSMLEAFQKLLGVPLEEDLLVEDFEAFRGVLEIDTKTFPTSRQGMSSIQAFRRHLPLAHPVEEIEAVRVFVPKQYRNMVDRNGPPRDRLDSLVGVGYQMALSALYPDRFSDALRFELLKGEAIDAFIAKVQVIEDAELSAAFPKQWSGRVEIQWKSAEPSVIEVREPEGAATKPMDWAGLEAKLQRIFAASRLGRPEDAAKLAEISKAIGSDPGGHSACGLMSQAASIAGIKSLAGSQATH